MFNVWQYADEDGAKTEHYDVVDGRQRLLEQAGEETQKIDEGIGIDRLAMLLTGAESIRDVILFPLLKPKK